MERGEGRRERKIATRITDKQKLKGVTYIVHYTTLVSHLVFVVSHFIWYPEPIPNSPVVHPYVYVYYLIVCWWYPLSPTLIIHLFIPFVQIGSPVEVRQPDGQYLSASVLKLTDQSTYTVGKLSDNLKRFTSPKATYKHTHVGSGVFVFVLWAVVSCGSCLWTAQTQLAFMWSWWYYTSNVALILPTCRGRMVQGCV